MKLLFGFLICLVACTPNEIPPTPARDDGGVVKIEKSICETTGPMQLSRDSEGHFPLTHVAPRADHFCALVLPIDDASLNLISTGAKLYDYRRSHPDDRISHVVFFNNLSLQLVGIAEVEESLAGTPQDLAQETYLHSGQTVEGVLNYFGGRDYGFAIAIRNFQTFTSPLSLAEARALDSKFQRPYGYLFLDRHPVIESELQRRRPEVVDETPIPDPLVVDGWSEL